MMSLIVHGEAEECDFLEKKWVAHVILNRMKEPEKFRSLEKDFKGFTRPMKITNRIERIAFIESVDAVIQAMMERFINIDPTHGAVFFATKEYIRNKDPTKIFGVLVEEVETPNSFKHRFFRLKEWQKNE